MLVVLGFLLGLPVSVWLLATLCAVIDEPRPILACIRLVLALCALLIVLLVTDRTLAYPLAAAFITVTFLHVLSFWAFRRFLLGVPNIHKQPDPPEITHYLDDIDERDQHSEGMY